MNKLFLAGLLAATPVLCSAETWTNVAMVDVDCSAKVKDNPDAHTKACALSCTKDGFGVVTSDGAFLKFDSEGNKQAAAALNASKASDHLRVTVEGDRDGDTIKVKSLKM